MRAAAAEVVVERLADLLIGGMRRAPDERGGGDHHAIGAVAALRRLFYKERLLHGMRLVGRAQALQRGDLRADGLADGQTAARHRLGPAQHLARAALLQPAAEERAVQPQLIAQDVEQRRFGGRLRLVRLPVHGDDQPSHRHSS